MADQSPIESLKAGQSNPSPKRAPLDQRAETQSAVKGITQMQLKLYTDSKPPSQSQ